MARGTRVLTPVLQFLQSPSSRMQLKKVAKVACRETKGTNGRGAGGWHTRSWSSEMSQKRKRQKRCLTASSSRQPGWAECFRPRSLVPARVLHAQEAGAYIRRRLVRVLAKIRRLDFSCSLGVCAHMSVRQQ